MKKFSTDFTQGNVPRQLFEFTLPLYASNILQIVYNVVDMIIVGQVLGKVGLSAVSVGGDAGNFLLFFSMGFSSAGQVIIAQLLGAGKSRELGRFIGNMTTFLFCGGIFLSVVCLLLREEILQLMNTPPEAFDEALGYATVTIIGLVFIYGYNAVSAVLRGLGDSKHPFIFIALAAVLNVLLDVVFVIFLGLGVKGAALATVLSQGTSFFACVIFLHRNRERLGFSISGSDFVTFDAKLLSHFVKLGLPMAIKAASIHLSKLFVNSWINSYGVEISAFAGVANKINSVAILLAQALNTAGASMVGQNIGAKKFRRVIKILQTIFAAAMGVALLMSATILIFPEQIFRLFTADEKVLAVGADYVPIAVIFFLGSACRAPMTALINGSGNYLANFATALFDGIILRIGLAIFFGLVLDMRHVGFWLGDALAGFTPLAIGMILYFSGRWKKVSI